MTRTKKSIGFASLSLLILFLALPAFAAGSALNSTSTGLNATGQSAGYGATAVPITTVIGQGIQIIIGVAGAVVALYMFYGGILWLTAGGESTKIDKAKHIIVNSVIGIAIILTAFSITTFAVDSLGQAASGTYSAPVAEPATTGTATGGGGS